MLDEVIAEGAAYIKILAVLFPVASAIGMVTMNARAEHHRKMQAIAAEIAGKRAEATGRRAETKVELPETTGNTAEDAPLLRDELPEASALVTATIDQWRAIAGNLNGETEALSASRVEELLNMAGLTAPSTRTARNWAADARKRHIAGKI